MGEDWFNGYDDDGDCPGDTNGDGLICYPGDEGVDEDYFFADGVDNDGDCPGDTNGDGVYCGPGDDNVDEAIDWTDDTWIDGVDNNNNGEVDEAEERFSNSNIKYNLPDWYYDIDFGNIIINNGRKNEYINDQYNPWYSETDLHLRGEHYYDEEEVKLFFDVYLYDFGDDEVPGIILIIDIFIFSTIINNDISKINVIVPIWQIVFYITITKPLFSFINFTIIIIINAIYPSIISPINCFINIVISWATVDTITIRITRTISIIVYAISKKIIFINSFVSRITNQSISIGITRTISIIIITIKPIFSHKSIAIRVSGIICLSIP
jgi:hypothetical protein